jgi:hypothetical protein
MERHSAYDSPPQLPEPGPLYSTPTITVTTNHPPQENLYDSFDPNPESSSISYSSPNFESSYATLDEGAKF